MDLSPPYCAILKRCTVLRRVLFLVTALVLLFALSAERAEFVHDYAELDTGLTSVLALDDGYNDAQDNEPFLPEEKVRCCRSTLPEGGADPIEVRAVLALYSPELRPPSLA